MAVILFSDIADSSALTERIGDGVMGLFQSAAGAIESALSGRHVASATGLELHIGLHAGDVIREENNVHGGAVNIAARICAASDPGQMLVSSTVRELARTSSRVTFLDHGEHSLRGIVDAVRLSTSWRRAMGETTDAGEAGCW